MKFVDIKMLKPIFLSTIWVIATHSVFSQSKLNEQTETYYDTERSRKLITEIWIPQNKNTVVLPLVMFSHGTGGNRLASRWFCEGLAEKGFVVAAVDHYGNTYDNPIPKEFVTIWQRPQDISFVLTKILSEETIRSNIDTSQIYAAGFSLGGYTSLALAGAKIDWDNLLNFLNTPQGFKETNIPEMPGLLQMFPQENIRQEFKNSPDLIDRRIKAVFVMAPAAGQGFPSKSQVERVTVPVFIAAAKADSIAPIKTNALHYKNILPNAKWYLLKGKAGHYVFLNEGTEEMKEVAPVFFKDADNVNRRKIHTLMVNQAAIFFGKRN